MPVHLTEEQLADYVAEAEEGYDVETLLARGRGRPGRGAKPAQVVTVRLTEAEIADLDELAHRLDVNRSEAIRHAIAHSSDAA